MSSCSFADRTATSPLITGLGEGVLSPSTARAVFTSNAIVLLEEQGNEKEEFVEVGAIATLFAATVNRGAFL